MTAVRAVAVLVVLLVAPACAGPGAQPRDPEADEVSEASAEQRRELEEFAGVPLPASAADVTVVTQSGIDAMLYARFTIAAEDLDALVAGAAFDPPPEEGHRLALPPPASVPWGEEIAALERTLGADEFDGSFAREIIIGLDDPDTHVVYVQATTV